MDLVCQVMKEEMRLEDVPELMQHIQLLLPEQPAARTSILSKSWLHAWSTIPVLRFHVPWEQKRKYLKMAYIDRTLLKYLRDNIPIEVFDLAIQYDKESASRVEKWIRSVSTNTCLKELSLKFDHCNASLNLPDELLSSKNLTKLRVSALVHTSHALWMTTSHNHPPVINCVSLRELYLVGVRISQQVLDHLMSSCRLLVKIKFVPNSVDLNTIKVKSLLFLDELEIRTSCWNFPRVEIDNVPNLRLVHCNLQAGPQYIHSDKLSFNTHSISLGSSLTELWLGGPGLVTDDASLNMIQSGLFPFLETLTLNMKCWTLASFHFTCAASPIKRIFLVACPKRVIEIQINAMSLLFFSLGALTIPRLSFPISSTLEEIKLRVSLRPVRASCLLKMREALELASKCYLEITANVLEMDFDLDDLKTRLQFPPATNVQSLSFETSKDECLWDNSQFFDAFFEIFHPKHVFAKPDIFFKHKNHFCKLMLREVLQKKTPTTTASWTHYLKRVQINTSCNEQWETLSNSHKSFLDSSTPINPTFKLEWC